MFTIEIKVPSDDEKSPGYIIDEENLDKIIDASWEDVLDPDFSPKVYIEWLWILFEKATFVSV